MICTRCNSNIPDNSTYCPYCNTSYKKSGKGLMISAYILYGIAFLAVIFFALFTFTDLFSPQDDLYDAITDVPTEYSDIYNELEDAVTKDVLDTYGN